MARWWRVAPLGEDASVEAEPLGPLTLCVDVGASSIKACLADVSGAQASSALSRKTRYPFGPDELIEQVAALAGRLEPADRAGLGFPGMVRAGRVLGAANLSRIGGEGSAIDEGLVDRWRSVELSQALQDVLGVEVIVANDADVAALGCARGEGVELTVTLGSGLGTGIVADGRLQAHLELSELELEGCGSLDELVGERARKLIGDGEWNRRVRAALTQLESIVGFDRLYLAGGNARRVQRNELGSLLERTWVVSEPVGLLGAVRLFA